MSKVSGNPATSGENDEDTVESLILLHKNKHIITDQKNAISYGNSHVLVDEKILGRNFFNRNFFHQRKIDFANKLEYSHNEYKPNLIERREDYKEKLLFLLKKF